MAKFIIRFCASDGRVYESVETHMLRGLHRKSHLVVYKMRVYVITSFERDPTDSNTVILYCKPTSSNPVIFLADDGTKLDSPGMNNPRMEIQ